MQPVLYVLYGAAIGFLIYWASLWGLHIIALVYGYCKLHRKVSLPDLEAKELDGVSIIKPLYQSQEILTENLETFFKLKYPKFELLLCIQEVEDSETYALVKQLIDLYPCVDAKIFRGGEEVGVNPKINNMTPAYRAVKYPLILVSDASIKMKEDTLLDMVLNMKDTVGLVHQMPYSCNRAGLPSILEKVYFGTSHARIYLSANLIGINCATGMSALMRKDLLDKAGGFPAFGCYLAEDFFFAKCIQEQGYYTVISTQPACQNPGTSSITYFQNRISRWTKLRLAMCPYTTILEPISECMVAGGLAAWSAYLLFRFDPVVFYLVHVLCWFLSDWVLIHIVQNGALPFNKFEFLVMWLFREVCAPYIMIHSVCNPSIRWRNLEYRLQWGGVAIAENVKPIPPAGGGSNNGANLDLSSDIVKCTDLEYSNGGSKKSGYYSLSSGEHESGGYSLSSGKLTSGNYSPCSDSSMPLNTSGDFSVSSGSLKLNSGNYSLSSGSLKLNSGSHSLCSGSGPLKISSSSASDIGYSKSTKDKERHRHSKNSSLDLTRHSKTSSLDLSNMIKYHLNDKKTALLQSDSSQKPSNL